MLDSQRICFKELHLPEGLRTYKKKEKLFYARLVSGTRASFRAVVTFPRRLRVWAGKKTSIIIVPHSETGSKRIRLSRFGLVSMALLFAGLLGFSTVASFRYAATLALLQAGRHELESSKAALDQLRDSAERLTGAALKFETGLSELLAISERRQPVGATAATRDQALQAAGLASLLNMPQSRGLGFREIERLEGLSDYLDAAAPGIERLSTILAGQKEIMSEIPNIWPIQGGIGHISMYFGQNENPFSSGQWYLHNGIDISTFRVGDPIIASADGKVIDVSYDGGLGNCVTIQHSHGFLTRYGHLQSFRVRKGQQVSQGQIIATLGNTGKSTGPHLHYEVHLGTSVIDPLRFLNVRKAGMR
jgi:murein DD-endopeptidase MepM/ murein hydrolase activator NlpD